MIDDPNFSSHSQINLVNLDIVCGVIPNYFEQPASIKVFQGLCDSGLYLLVPTVQLLGLTLVRNVKNVEALFKIENFPHSFEIDQESMESFLVEEDSSAPTFSFQIIHFTHIYWD